jgi:hypothetical protein
VPRIVAILAAYNEERFIAQCLEHLHANGVEAYLCDNQSTDRTVQIAETFLGRGLRGRLHTFVARRGGRGKFGGRLLAFERTSQSSDLLGQHFDLLGLLLHRLPQFLEFLLRGAFLRPSAGEGQNDECQRTKRQ